MDQGKDLDIAYVSARPWGAAYLREHDLMIAANEFAAAQTGQALYNAEFDRACAARLLPLDGECEMRRLETVEVPLRDTSRDQHTATQATIRSVLGGAPRGHWAVFRVGDCHDAYVSNGLGGIATESGKKFTYRSDNAPAFRDVEMYAHVLGMMNYLRRNEIRNAIIAHSVASAQVAVGTGVRDVALKGKTWSRVEYAGIRAGYYSGGGDAYTVTARRRGVAPTGFIVADAVLMRIFGIAHVMPPAFEDAGNAERVLDIVKAPASTGIPTSLGPRLEIRTA